MVSTVLNPCRANIYDAGGGCSLLILHYMLVLSCNRCCMLVSLLHTILHVSSLLHTILHYLHISSNERASHSVQSSWSSVKY
ncbi:hypothetical protein B0T21DRAFT_44555 [Apiosordaria backusii]|uniref:Uncharacterized protein n=1 Tax=Apiosordaria backusii TaxID=314023 RepID=A0AA40AXK6_9PEZI|nr:hypothetical protein B0T21DRAFT_44555 [Apiosordaria backusii]